MAKIALCFSGHMRRYYEVFHSIEKNVINPLKNLGQLDIFISTWNKRNSLISGSAGTGKIDVDLVDLEIQKENILELYQPVGLEIENFELIKEYFKLTNFTNNLFGPAATLFGDFLSIIPAFYKIERANCLKCIYERENHFIYDLVVRARPDSIIVYQMEFEINNNVVTIMAHNPGINDQFFFGPSRLMNKATRTYSNLKQIFTTSIDRGGENTLEQNFLIEQIPFKVYNKLYNSIRYVV